MNDNRPRIDTLIRQGMTAQQAQRFGEAEQAYRSVLQMDATNPQALALLGTLAGIAGRFDIAISLFTQALQRDPLNADLYHNLGETHRHLGDIAKALPAFNRAIELRPEHLDAYRSAADTAFAAADQTKGPDAAKNAHALRRLAAQYLFKLGRKLHSLRKGGVEEVFREAAELDPDDGEILYALGTVLQELSRPSEAVDVLRRAIDHGSKDADTYNNLGNAYSALQRWDEMETALRAAIAADPRFVTPQQNLDSITLMRTLYEDGFTPAESFERHRAWGAAVTAAHNKVDRPVAFTNSCEPERRLRVAYLSPDFRNHSVGYFLHPLLAHHDPQAIEVVCYSEVDKPDTMTDELRRLSSLWRDSFQLDDIALRAQLRADRIDIAIELAGQTAKNRLRALAIKAAPVTASWLGYPATTGLDTIDWRITDALVDPPGAEQFYTEKLLRLDEGFLCYEPPRDAPPVAAAPVMTSGGITFGSFNNVLKISASTLDAWAAVLRAVPRSRLILKSPTLIDREIRARYIEAFATRGIERGRVELRSFIAQAASHLAAYGEIDIALDPFPYNGTTTTCEAMWMGVPVVTLIGDRHAGRVGFDLLSRVGLSEFAAPDRAGYIANAVALAGDLTRLQVIRAGLRERMGASPLCDAPCFSRSFERALRDAWHQWCRSETSNKQQ